MANEDDIRLQALEDRLKKLEGGEAGGVGQGSGETKPSEGGSPASPTEVQAFLQGMLVATALQARTTTGSQPQVPGQAPGTEFLTIPFTCGGGGGGGGGPTFTRYDSIFWCPSRFVCGPTIACFC